MPQNDTNLLPPKKKCGKRTSLDKNVKKCPVFFKEVRFEKRAPLVISREFVNPFAKTGGKASILARPSTSRLSSLFAAYFLGTDAQKNRQRGFDGSPAFTNRQPGTWPVRRPNRQSRWWAQSISQIAGRHSARSSHVPQTPWSSRKTVVKRYKRTCKEKNEKRYLFERNGPKVPCFCEEVPFSKGSPSTISRELKVPPSQKLGEKHRFSVRPTGRTGH
jgi:hypothetical protein